MLPLIIAVCGAAGAVVGAITTHAVGEVDRQAAKRYKKINAELINSRDNLQQRYYELSDRSKEQINGLNLKLAESEVEKDALHLAVRLQNELIFLMESIDKNPSLEILAEFKKAVVLTNYVLEQLNESLVPVSQEYFSRALIRVDRSHNYKEEELVSFMSVLMNPPQDTVANLLNEIQDDILPAEEVVAEENNISNFQAQTTQNSQEDYEIRLKDFESKKQQQKQEAELARKREREQEKEAQRQAKFLEQQQKQEAELARKREREQEKEAQRQAKFLEQQ